jgi:rhodanese-related sulfurtransferase
LKKESSFMSQQDLRISAAELKKRMSAGEEFTILDARNPQAWVQAADKAHGAIRVDAHAGDEALPRLPHNKPIVVYCT